MEGNESVPFYDDEKPWDPATNCYPTWDDVVRFYISRTQNGNESQAEVKRQLSLFVYNIWESGDGCPKAPKNIAAQFTSDVLSIYTKYRKGEGRVTKSHRTHKKKKDSVTPEPTRKSRRLNKTDESALIDDVPSSSGDTESSVRVLISDSNEDANAVKSMTRKVKLRRKDIEVNINKQHWLEDHGTKLFDVFSNAR